MNELGNGWFESSWFGSFQSFQDTQWIYHTKLGWIYAPIENDNGIWLWMEKEGWLWTKKQVWPYLWKHKVGEWLYYLGNRKNNRPIFFDFNFDSYR